MLNGYVPHLHKVYLTPTIQTEYELLIDNEPQQWKIDEIVKTLTDRFVKSNNIDVGNLKVIVRRNKYNTLTVTLHGFEPI